MRFRAYGTLFLGCHFFYKHFAPTGHFLPGFIYSPTPAPGISGVSLLFLGTSFRSSADICDCFHFIA